MQARIWGLVWASVAVAVLVAPGGANAQLFDKKQVRDTFAGMVENMMGQVIQPFSGISSAITKECKEGISDGSRYEGELRDGKPHGPFVMTGPDGERLEGECRDGKLHGPLVSTLPDGSSFEGEYRDGKQHGLFVFSTAVGTYTESEYRDGKLHGPFVTTEGGISIEGEYRDGKLHGYFLMRLEEGLYAEGEYRDGVPVEGTVTVIHPDFGELRG